MLTRTCIDGFHAMIHSSGRWASASNSMVRPTSSTTLTLQKPVSGQNRLAKVNGQGSLRGVDGGFDLTDDGHEMFEGHGRTEDHFLHALIIAPQLGKP